MSIYIRNINRDNPIGHYAGLDKANPYLMLRTSDPLKTTCLFSSGYETIPAFARPAYTLNKI